MASQTTSLSVDQAAGATEELIAAQTGYRIQVTGFMLSVENGALGVNSTLQDTTADTVRVTLTSQAATSVVVYSYAGTPDAPAFETAVSEGLELVTGVAALVAGFINYRYVK
jgi:hypothetical protein